MLKKQVFKKISDCSACGACKQICPENAIEMRPDEEGFVYPHIIGSLCSDCGLCRDKCPSLHPDFRNSSNPAYYAVGASDELRRQSPSGGAFAAMAEYVLENKGYVAGAAFDDCWGVEHIVISEASELPRLQGSKYVQSEIKPGYYAGLKALLQTGRMLLFSGMPCQVAGFKRVLGAEYKNLITVDLACLGVPPAKLFKKYLKEMFNDDQVLSVNFRDKTYGWHDTMSSYKNHISIETNNTTYSVPINCDPYWRAFSATLALRPSCYPCPFKGRLPRQGDCSIGDCWGIDKYYAETKDHFHDGLGLSMLSVNNAMGADFFDQIKDRFKIRREIPLKYAQVVYKSSSGAPLNYPPPSGRRNFFQNIDRFTLEENLAFNLDGQCDCLIVNMWDGANYGAVLLAYSLQEMLKEMGYRPKLARFYPPGRIVSGAVSNFAARYLDVTLYNHRPRQIKKLDQITDTYILGGDTAWFEKHIPPFSDLENKFFLRYFHPEKKKIACSVSFLFDFNPMDAKTETRRRRYVQEFDAVSVREDSGVEICRAAFQVQATHLLDPVLALGRDGYEKIIANGQDKAGTEPEGEFFFAYLIASNAGPSQAFFQAAKKKVSEELGLPWVDINPLGSPAETSIEDFLSLISHSSLLLTSSYHGVCLALLFNKPFVALAVPNSRDDRLPSLLRLLSLEERLVRSPDDLAAMDGRWQIIDYARVNQIIERERARFKDWLASAMRAPKKSYDRTQADRAYYEWWIDLLGDQIDSIKDAMKKQSS